MKTTMLLPVLGICVFLTYTVSARAHLSQPERHEVKRDLIHTARENAINTANNIIKSNYDPPNYMLLPFGATLEELKESGPLKFLSKLCDSGVNIDDTNDEEDCEEESDTNIPSNKIKGGADMADTEKVSNGDSDDTVVVEALPSTELSGGDGINVDNDTVLVEAHHGERDKVGDMEIPDPEAETSKVPQEQTDTNGEPAIEETNAGSAEPPKEEENEDRETTVQEIAEAGTEAPQEDANVGEGVESNQEANENPEPPKETPSVNVEEAVTNTGAAIPSAGENADVTETTAENNDTSYFPLKGQGVKSPLTIHEEINEAGLVPPDVDVYAGGWQNYYEVPNGNPSKEMPNVNAGETELPNETNIDAVKPEEENAVAAEPPVVDAGVGDVETPKDQEPIEPQQGDSTGNEGANAPAETPAETVGSPSKESSSKDSSTYEETASTAEQNNGNVEIEANSNPEPAKETPNVNAGENDKVAEPPVAEADDGDVETPKEQELSNAETQYSSEESSKYEENDGAPAEKENNGNTETANISNKSEPKEEALADQAPEYESSSSVSEDIESTIEESAVDDLEISYENSLYSESPSTEESNTYESEYSLERKYGHQRRKREINIEPPGTVEESTAESVDVNIQLPEVATGNAESSVGDANSATNSQTAEKLTEEVNNNDQQLPNNIVEQPKEKEVPSEGDPAVMIDAGDAAAGQIESNANNDENKIVVEELPEAEAPAGDKVKDLEISEPEEAKVPQEETNIIAAVVPIAGNGVNIDQEVAESVSIQDANTAEVIPPKPEINSKPEPPKEEGNAGGDVINQGVAENVETPKQDTSPGEVVQPIPEINSNPEPPKEEGDVGGDVTNQGVAENAEPPKQDTNADEVVKPVPEINPEVPKETPSIDVAEGVTGEKAPEEEIIENAQTPEDKPVSANAEQQNDNTDAGAVDSTAVTDTLEQSSGGDQEATPVNINKTADEGELVAVNETAASGVTPSVENKKAEVPKEKKKCRRKGDAHLQDKLLGFVPHKHCETLKIILKHVNSNPTRK